MAGLSEGPKWWERADEPDTVWRACVTDDGLDYYVNTETNETSYVYRLRDYAEGSKTRAPWRTTAPRRWTTPLTA